MGLAELKTQYTSVADASIGKAGTPENVTHLRAALISRWKTIKENKLVLNGDAAIPKLHSRKLVQFGGVTAQRKECESQLRDHDELHAAATALRSAPRVARAMGARAPRPQQPVDAPVTAIATKPSGADDDDDDADDADDDDDDASGFSDDDMELC